MEAAEVGSGFDDPMGHTCHLGGDGDIGHALAIGTCGITPEISFELVPEAVLGLAHGDRCSHPEDATQPCVAVLRELSGTAEQARLLRRQIEATELEELTMMAEAAQIAGFSQDGERQDGANAGDLLQALEVGVVLEMESGPLFELIAQLAKSDHLTQHDAEHGDGFRVFAHRDTDRRLSRAIDVFKQALFTDLPSNNRPGLLDKLFYRETSDHGGRGKDAQQLKQPLGA